MYKFVRRGGISSIVDSDGVRLYRSCNVASDPSAELFLLIITSSCRSPSKCYLKRTISCSEFFHERRYFNALRSFHPYLLI